MFFQLARFTCKKLGHLGCAGYRTHSVSAGFSNKFQDSRFFRVLDFGSPGDKAKEAFKLSTVRR